MRVQIVVTAASEQMNCDRRRNKIHIAFSACPLLISAFAVLTVGLMSLISAMLYACFYSKNIRGELGQGKICIQKEW